jgi:hypothetical protein
MIAEHTKQNNSSVVLLIVNSMVLSFGLTLFIFTSLYQQDLAAIQRLPEAIWLFVCGVPTEDPIALPLLQVISGVATVGSIAAFILPPLFKRKHKEQNSSSQSAPSA